MNTRNREGRDVVIEAPVTFVDRVRSDGVHSPVGIPPPPQAPEASCRLDVVGA